MSRVAEAVFVMAAGQSPYLFELADALRHELEGLGIRTALSTEGFPDPRGGSAYVLLGPHQYYAIEGHAAPPEPSVFARTLLICSTPPESEHFKENVALAPGSAGVFELGERSVRALYEAGVRAQHLPIGYTPYWDRFDATRDRPVDVALYGAYTERRGRALGSYADSLWRHRSALWFSDDSPRSEKTGEDKWALLCGSKALLCIHRRDEPQFEWLRAVHAIHAGCAVVSEHSAGHPPLVPGDHLLMGRLETLGHLAQNLIEDPSALAEMRARAYGFLRDELPMSRHVVPLAEAIERVAALPATGRGTRPQRAAQDPPAPQPPSLTADPDASALRHALKETQLQLIELRRDIAGLRAAAAGETLAPTVLRSTAAFAAAPQPRVSVVIPVYNHAQRIIEALESVRTNWFKDVEIVGVDDGSSDDSRQAVEGWMGEHGEVSVSLVVHPVNRGLPRARNTGIDFARGELVLMLDADNTLLPHCIERLVEALDRDAGAAFAYGILSAFDARGPRRLLSQFGWDPRRLRTGNYIDALALIRTAVLRELGGFKTDRRLFGVEDWDLWATMADAGHAGAFVPEIVARYRISGVSMLSVTGLSHTAMFAAMAEYHPELMRGVEPPL
jgi:Glycosyl transferase family 2